MQRTYRPTNLACVVAAAGSLTGAPVIASDKHTLQLDPSSSLEGTDEEMQGPQPPSLLVFSGGTAFNSVAGMHIN